MAGDSSSRSDASLNTACSLHHDNTENSKDLMSHRGTKQPPHRPPTPVFNFRHIIAKDLHHHHGEVMVELLARQNSLITMRLPSSAIRQTHAKQNNSTAQDANALTSPSWNLDSAAALASISRVRTDTSSSVRCSTVVAPPPHASRRGPVLIEDESHHPLLLVVYVQNADHKLFTCNGLNRSEVERLSEGRGGERGVLSIYIIGQLGAS